MCEDERDLTTYWVGGGSSSDRLRRNGVGGWVEVGRWARTVGIEENEG